MNSHRADSRPIFNNSDSKYEYIGNNLTHEDWEKLIFLCGSFISKEDELRILNRLQSSQAQHIQNFKDVIYPIRVNNVNANSSDEEHILLELLYHLKKYCVLKTLHSCKHKQAEKQERSFIKPLWKYLFNVVEDLTEEELQFVASKLDSSSINCVTFYSAKGIFQNVIEKNDEDIRRLKEIFRSCLPNRPGLLEKAIEFEKSKKPCYKIDEGRKYGYAVIFNHLKFDKPPPVNSPNRTDLEVRKGTNRDKDNLKKLWEEYGMDVDVHDNLTSVDFKTTIVDLSRTKNYDSYQIFICCILSHGTEDYIYASDGVVVQISWIHKQFGEYTTSLKNKPKLFFIQACQGDESNRFMSDANPPNDQRMEVIQPRAQSRQKSKTPLQADILIGTSTVPGFRSWRSEEHGSIYIQTLFDILSERGDKDELSELMKDINLKVSLKEINGVTCQMPTITHQLRYNLYLKKFPVKT